MTDFTAPFWTSTPRPEAVTHDLTKTPLILTATDKNGQTIHREIIPPNTDTKVKGHRRTFDTGKPIRIAV